MIRPASSTATIRLSSTAPVSVSTSTTATCAPNGNVGCEAWKSTSALSSVKRPCAADRLTGGGDLDGAELLLGDAVGHLHVCAQADPQLAGGAVLAPAGLLAAQLLVAGALEREVQRAAVVADVVVRARRGGVR